MERYAKCGIGGGLWARATEDLLQPTFAAWTVRPFSTRPTAAECDPKQASTPFSGGLNTALADGSVRPIAPSISPQTWWSLCTPNGGEVLGNDW